jgi:hypothetical protein
MPASTCWRAAMSRYMGNEIKPSPFFWRAETSTSADGSCTGSGRSSRALMNVKIAVFAPMPSASDSTAAAVKAGAWRSPRSA